MAHSATPNPNNKLSAETSPYLLQHQDNPVDWWAWGEAALAEAKRSNRPILLSVGYAACHWCHVMAHESFEDPEIAALMNKLYVNIKVDREERPDLDAIYQQALALLGQQGGWPLTMFLTPEGRPFWGGTYFPPASRWGRPGFADVLATLAETFAEEPDKVQKNVDGLREAMTKLASPQAGGAISMDITNQIADAPARGSRPGAGRHRPGAEIPAGAAVPAVLARLEAHQEPGLQERGGADPDAHEPGRHLRSSRRRLRALLGRRQLAGAAFREDALRQRRADRPADADVAGDARPLVPGARARDRRMAGARDAGGAERRRATARLPPRSMRIPKARKASSMSGPRPRSTRCSARSPRSSSSITT